MSDFGDLFITEAVASLQVFFILINDTCLVHFAEARMFSVLLHWDLFSAVAVNCVFAHFFLDAVIDVPLALIEGNRAARALHLIDPLELAEA